MDDVTDFKIYFRSLSRAMADSRKKKERGKYKKLNILRLKNAFWKK